MKQPIKTKIVKRKCTKLRTGCFLPKYVIFSDKEK